MGKLWTKIGELWAKIRDAGNIALFTVTLTLAIFIYQNYETRNLEKSKFLTEYTTAFISSKLHDTLVEIEYNKFPFSKLVTNSDEEKELSSLLDFLNIVSYNVDNGYIPVKDLRESTLEGF